jgi:FAD/FMN-containing dehydrogenase
MLADRPVDVLREVFSGTLILPGDPGYDRARTVFNAMIDRRPAVIARCETTADVAAAVGFARENELLVAVRCGGHSVAGLGVSEGGIVIDLGGLKTIEVDPAARTGTPPP